MHARPRWASASVRLGLAAALSGVSCAPPGTVTAPTLPASSASTVAAPPDAAPPDAAPLDLADATSASDPGAGPPLSSPRTIDASAPARYRACATTADCVAVPRVGCCHNGWREAVAASQKDAYAASFTCPDAHPICAMFIVRDTRVAACDAPTHLCTMVAR